MSEHDQRNICNWRFVAPISIEGFGDCDTETIVDICQFEESTTLDFFIQNGQLEWYEAEAVDEEESPWPNPEEPEPPGPPPVMCDPCSPDGKYIGQYPEMFTVGGDVSSAIYAGSVEITIVKPSKNPDDDGRSGIKAVIDDRECCCTGTPVADDPHDTYILDVSVVTLSELRGNVDSRRIPDCDGCGCPSENPAVCYGVFHDACPGLVSVIEVIRTIEINNCSSYK